MCTGNNIVKNMLKSFFFEKIARFLIVEDLYLLTVITQSFLFVNGCYFYFLVNLLIFVSHVSIWGICTKYKLQDLETLCLNFFGNAFLYQTAPITNI